MNVFNKKREIREVRDTLIPQLKSFYNVYQITTMYILKVFPLLMSN